MTRGGTKLNVQLTGGGPWGFRLQGGAEISDPLTVYKIRRKSKAHNTLSEGDVILSINGISCDKLDYDQAMDIVDAAEGILEIELFRPQKGKENVAPETNGIDSTPDYNTIIKEENSTEYNKKTVKETADIRITSATMSLEKQFPAMNEVKPIPSHITETISEAMPMEVDSAPITEPLPHEHRESSPMQRVIKDDLKDTENNTIETEEQVQKETNIKYTDKCSTVTNGDAKNSEITDTQDKSDIITSDTKESDLGTISSIPTLPTTVESTPKTETGCKEHTDASLLFKVKKFDKKPEHSVWNPLGSSATSVPKGGVPVFKMDVPSSTEESTRASFWKPSTLPTTKTGDENITKTSSSAQEQVKKVPPPIPPKPKQRPVSAPPMDIDILDQAKLEETFQPPPETDSTNQSTRHAYEPASDSDFDGYATFPRRKKMYSSSSFYEDPSANYPTVEEQVELCRKIADSLSADKNQKSRGANMFYRRVKRSQKWVHEYPEDELEHSEQKVAEEKKCTEKIEVEPQTQQMLSAPCIKVSEGPPKLKLILDPRHLQDANQLRKAGQNISEHNVVSPDICLGLVKDLNSPVGKGAVMFAKRKKKSEKWVVDEDKVKSHHPPQKELAKSETGLAATKTGPQINKLQEIVHNPRLKIVKSPWEAALESPIGSCDAAFVEVRHKSPPDALAASVLKASETKVLSSAAPTPAQVDSSSPAITTAPVATSQSTQPASFEIYRPRAPKGWGGPGKVSNVSAVQRKKSPPSSEPAPSSRLETVPPSAPQKMSFRNFNTTPKTWLAVGAIPGHSTFKPVKTNLGFTK
ncbi:uncharacterized protein LOC143234155 isoform X1 [Tachypleus tridentatus]|uniref:uncharacterized protein LOC143234155 isoform X1 n=1 Tax=Tachypleus tridentatus TaxID=6853 RepID=UPI003FD3888B